MLPHSAPMVGLPSGNIQHMCVLPLQTWNIYGNEMTNADLPSENPVTNFKTLAERNGIRVCNPREENDNAAASVVVGNLSAEASEFIPRSSSPSPALSDKKLLGILEDLLDKQKEQAQLLQVHVKDQDESSVKIANLLAEKSALQDEVQTANEELRKIKERNLMLSHEVEALTDRLLESEQTSARLRTQVETLLEKLRRSDETHESEKESMTSLRKKLEEAELGRESAFEELAKLVSERQECCCKNKRLQVENILSDNKNENNKDEIPTVPSTIKTEDSESISRMDSLDNILPTDDDLGWTVVTKRGKAQGNAALSRKISQPAIRKEHLKPSYSVDGTVTRANAADVNCLVKEKPNNWIARNEDDQQLTDTCSTLKVANTVDATPRSDVSVRNTFDPTASTSMDSCEEFSGLLKKSESTVDEMDDILDKKCGPCVHVNQAGEPPLAAGADFKSQSYLPNSLSSISHTAYSACTPSSSFQTSASSSYVDSLFHYTEPLSQQYQVTQSSCISSSNIQNNMQYQLFKPGSSVAPPIPFSQFMKDPIFLNTPASTRSVSTNEHHKSLNEQSNNKVKSKIYAKNDLTPFYELMNKLCKAYPSKTREELMVLLKLAKINYGDDLFKGKSMENIVKRVGELFL